MREILINAVAKFSEIREQLAEAYEAEKDPEAQQEIFELRIHWRNMQERCEKILAKRYSN